LLGNILHFHLEGLFAIESTSLLSAHHCHYFLRHTAKVDERPHRTHYRCE
jgi:hypothetical protein